jgi:hypothetical protein
VNQSLLGSLPFEMPPKKKADGPSKKTEQKKKEKIIEDKTFGLKNKKGTKQQKFIKNVTTQVQHGNQKASKLQAQQESEKAAKRDEKKKLQDEINSLFRPVAQSVKKGVDPKSVLCAFFKQGQCTKGDKCKFSHDLTIERKGEKRNIYEEEKNETMENWDEATLEDVVNKKHGESDKAKPKTGIICKFFLDAVESNKYGWFWECPTGKKCIYRHCLPPGFVLKKDKKKDEKDEKISIEDLVETERASLGFNTTKVTLETFLKWKERKKKEKLQQLMADQEKKKTDYKAGRTVGISGRQMFEFNPDLIMGDDDGDEGGAVAIEREVEEMDEETKVVDIDLSNFTATDVDASGTQAVADRLANPPTVNGTSQPSESEKLGEAAALPSTSNAQTRLQEETDAAIAAAVDATINGDLDIDEDLFAGDDIDLVEEDLETLELDDDTAGL